MKPVFRFPVTHMSHPYALPHADNIGDMRFCAIPIDGRSRFLGKAFGTGNRRYIAGEVGTEGGDVRFDTAENWRREGELRRLGHGILNI